MQETDLQALLNCDPKACRAAYDELVRLRAIAAHYRGK
jgi:hypothetical protein